MADKTYPVLLTYAEMELLFRATHSGVAELYCDNEPCDPDLPPGTDAADAERAETIRAKLRRHLNRIDDAAEHRALRAQEEAAHV
ncbi:MAG: hypothetical protein HQL37_15810 [Alphaproteobacteria bacterium]|nr:hypothetical protein [Alphaproteobacteria bacterium]